MLITGSHPDLAINHLFSTFLGIIFQTDNITLRPLLLMLEYYANVEKNLAEIQLLSELNRISKFLESPQRIYLYSHVNHRYYASSCTYFFIYFFFYFIFLCFACFNFLLSYLLSCCILFSFVIRICFVLFCFLSYFVYFFLLIY